MQFYAGLDVTLRGTNVCVVDGDGQVAGERNFRPIRTPSSCFRRSGGELVSSVSGWRLLLHCLAVHGACRKGPSP